MLTLSWERGGRGSIRDVLQQSFSRHRSLKPRRFRLPVTDRPQRVDLRTIERRDDVRAAIDVLGPIAHLDLDAVALRHLACERLAMRARRAVDLEPADVAHAAERLHVRTRHAARAEHADDARILSRHV